jgi:NMD protein affecting ribosome stability and mRNA decay
MTRALESGSTHVVGKGTRAGEPYGTRFREKGQMTARSTDVYLPKQGMKEVAVCTGCNALYWNKRWYLHEDESTKLSAEMVRNEVICPACQRIQDNYPAGVVTFTGDYLVLHENEILNTIKNVEEKARTKNPLARIMEIKQEGNVLTIRTTSDKLAEKLGRDIYKAHSGDLEYQWSKQENFVRVNWSRET